MHLVHHSTEIDEQQSNYGFALSLWDRLFGTYAIESKNGRDRQAIGLAELQDSQPTRILHTLRLPLT
jgi:sterol desaturase/sphingolipid hydroxylase (fatty acid hydroxylase superfamily)